MSIKYLVSNSIPERMNFIKKSKPFGKRIAIFNHVPLRSLESYFDSWYKLSDLYNDETFLKLLAVIDSKTSIFIIDMGLDYCSFKADYIKPYTKLHPLSSQAKETFIIDSFAFYNTEKSIYRPFLYIDPEIIGSTVQEFYNSKGFEHFEENKIENYYKVIKPFIKISTKPLDIEVISYEPTNEEKKSYEKLKEDVIMVQKFPKQKVITSLQKFINSSYSKLKAIKKIDDDDILSVTENTNKSRVQMYKDILINNPSKIVFYSSNFYGIDEIELSRTKDALIRHNKLIKLING